MPNLCIVLSHMIGNLAGNRKTAVSRRSNLIFASGRREVATRSVQEYGLKRLFTRLPRHLLHCIKRILVTIFCNMALRAAADIRIRKDFDICRWLNEKF